MNTFIVDKGGSLVHVMDHNVRAIVAAAEIESYVKNSDFETQLAYQRVQEDLTRQQAEVAAKAEAELRKQTAGIEALVDKLVREKLASMTGAAPAGNPLGLPG